MHIHFHFVTSYSLSKSLKLSNLPLYFFFFFFILFIILHHHNQTFFTKAFKDHLFWSLETRSTHYNLHFHKNSSSLLLYSKPPPSPLGGVITFFIFAFTKAPFSTLGSDLSFILLFTQESLKLGSYYGQELQVRTWENLHTLHEQKFLCLAKFVLELFMRCFLFI